MISTSHLHPMLVHFPIALLAFGFLADLASFIYKKEVCLTKLSYYLLLFGTISALVTLLSGVLFTSEMSGTAGDIKETHELFAWLTLIFAVLTSLTRVYLKLKNKEETGLKWLAFSLYALSAIFVSITGFFGGTLVYNYMMPL